ncbi:Rrf2 family transcriptional regulator [Alsobacter sp. SYSU M60028]|uniref:Rrf2 family transcriptional regulator n=1 Tax=Alsobacter ponti TaxID=2962936 RepID=A0ABT1L7Y0_9HYPH|nr:Rrf2 family transcriptional regulator [Alsobacter ponti]MCP8937587.1 Rrf2 family transcriptional regulator [Alsobacter ponti]
MKLTSHTDFGLRVLMSLAAAPERLMTIEDLAARHRLSRNHLMKVANSLIRAGFVTGLRGRGGGLRLASAPESIRVGDVVRALEDDVALVACLGDEPASCVFTGVCRLTGALGRALAAFLAELDAVTLADLVAPRQALRARLSLATAGEGAAP